MVNKKPTVLSLFTGAGGMDIGFHRQGYNIVTCIENEQKFCRTLELNKGKYLPHDTKIICDDIKNIFPKDVMDSVDVIIGGPPCQTFSAQGRRGGLNDKRGLLIFDFIRFLKELHPKVFVMENVRGLKEVQKGIVWEALWKSLEELKDIGYKINWDLLNAADYGVPQRRERIFIIGCLGKKLDMPRPTHAEKPMMLVDGTKLRKWISVWDVIGDIDGPNEPGEELGGMYGHLLPDIPEGMNYSYYTEKRGHPNPVFGWRTKFHNFLYKVDRKKPCRTLQARPGSTTGPFHWRNRKMRSLELIRLQTFPDDYEFNGGKAKVIQQIGNSVPPALAEAVAKSVFNQVFK